MTKDNHIQFISAGAGSGKTYSLTENLHVMLVSGQAEPQKVIATTFTVKAATELRERVRQKLLEKGESDRACQMGEALIGTVNSVCGQLLQRFSYEAGLSPELSVIDEQESRHQFNIAMESRLGLDTIRKMNALAWRLGQSDWREQVQSIAKSSRANNIKPDALPAMGRASGESLLSYFSAPVSRDINTALLAAIDTALHHIDGQQKNTLAYRAFIDGFKRSLKDNNCQWSQWVKLTKAKPAKAYDRYAETIAQIALDYEKHPQLHKDILEYTETLFCIASESVQTFQDNKAREGFIDFVDQEILLLDLLEQPKVSKRLSGELDLLMVDEFQDTSPVQLALFLKLAKCARKVVFVGDIKQAIYGFRGSDPALMFALVKQLQQSGGTIDILEHSWRSCKSLVQYHNAVFTRDFDNTLTDRQVVLDPQREDMANETVLEHWCLSEGNATKRYHALAGAIKSHIHSKRPVYDTSQSLTRAINYGDICILTRSNDNVDKLASVLLAHQIPVQKTQADLLVTPEATLVLACIRRLMDNKDTLASAEILSLSESQEPELWLQNRLEYLHLHQKSDTSKWVDDSELVRQLIRMQKTLTLYSPSEVVEHIIIDLHLRSIVNQWGEDQTRSTQRLNNLDSLIAMAVDYEQYCQSKMVPATLSGLLLWLKQQNQEGSDEQARVSGQEAVHIMTYHKSKGLEWPVVILMELNKPLRARIWETIVISPDSGFDVNQPLENRQLQFWPNLFGKHTKDVAVLERIETSGLGMQAYAEAAEEEKRLLYVAMTRARDQLILASNDNKGIKQGGCLALTGCDWLLPDAEDLSLPGTDVTIKTAKRTFTAVEPDSTQVAYTPQWFRPYPDGTQKRVAILRPSQAEGNVPASAGEPLIIGRRMPIKGDYDMAEVGQAVHAVMAAKCINQHFSAVDTEQILSRYDILNNIYGAQVLQAADNLLAYIHRQYPDSVLYAEYPVQHRLDNGQVIKGWVDLLIKTSKGWVICDHKTSPQKISDLKPVALSYSGQLALYAQAVSAVSQQPVLATLIHFPVSGVIVPVSIDALTVSCR